MERSCVPSEDAADEKSNAEFKDVHLLKAEKPKPKAAEVKVV